jgi:hypothetical protein
MRFFIAHSLLFAVCLPGCLSIEAEIEESCITRKDVEIPGVPEASISQTFVVDDLSDVHRLLEHGSASLQLTRADIRPTSGVTSLDFVSTARIDLEGTMFFGCDGDCPTESGVLALLSANQEDAIPYLQGDQLGITLAVSGAMPIDAWTVDVDICVAGNVSYELTP